MRAKPSIHPPAIHPSSFEIQNWLIRWEYFDSFLFFFFTILIDELRTNRSYAEMYPPVLRWVVDRYQLRKINSPTKCCTGFNEFLIKSRTGRDRKRRRRKGEAGLAASDSRQENRSMPNKISLPSPRFVCAVNIRNS